MQPDIFQQSIVVFSQNYLPVGKIHLKRAIALLITGRAEPLPQFEQTFWQIRSPQVTVRVPDCIRLISGRPDRQCKPPNVSRREVLKRDRHACQYCGATRNLTLDHVLPRSRGGGNTWENLVTACEPCNTRKGNRTPQEANMVLRNKPRAPMHPTVAFAEQFWRDRTQSY